jgi:hypothetical protein
MLSVLGAGSVICVVMHRRAAIIAFVALLLCGLAFFWFLRTPSAEPQLQAKVVAYAHPIEGPTDILLAETKFQTPGGWSLADPRLEVLVETSTGWRRSELVMFSSTAPCPCRENEFVSAAILAPRQRADRRTSVDFCAVAGSAPP